MKEKLQAKLQELQDGLAKANAAVAQAAANVNAFTGAIQVVQQLLAEEAANAPTDSSVN
jgi:hypothetical protein